MSLQSTAFLSGDWVPELDLCGDPLRASPVPVAAGGSYGLAIGTEGHRSLCSLEARADLARGDLQQLDLAGFPTVLTPVAVLYNSEETIPLRCDSKARRLQAWAALQGGQQLSTFHIQLSTFHIPEPHDLQS